jgi:hypothetical protein
MIRGPQRGLGHPAPTGQADQTEMFSTSMRDNKQAFFFVQIVIKYAPPLL